MENLQWSWQKLMWVQPRDLVSFELTYLTHVERFGLRMQNMLGVLQILHLARPATLLLTSCGRPWISSTNDLKGS